MPLSVLEAVPAVDAPEEDTEVAEYYTAVQFRPCVRLNTAVLLTHLQTKDLF